MCQSTRDVVRQRRQWTQRLGTQDSGLRSSISRDGWEAVLRSWAIGGCSSIDLLAEETFGV